MENVIFDYGFGELGFGKYIRDSKTSKVIMFEKEIDHIKELYIKRKKSKTK